MIPRTLCQPCSYLGVSVRDVVVNGQVNVLFFGDAVIEILQERQASLAATPRLALPDHFTRGHIECGKQCCGALAEVVVCDALNLDPAPPVATAGCAQRPGSGSSRPRIAPAPCPVDLGSKDVSQRVAAIKSRRHNAASFRIERSSGTRLSMCSSSSLTRPQRSMPRKTAPSLICSASTQAR